MLAPSPGSLERSASTDEPSFFRAANADLPLNIELTPLDKSTDELSPLKTESPQVTTEPSSFIATNAPLLPTIELTFVKSL